MPLNLYRRHNPTCRGGHEYDSRSGEFDERKKTWRKCECPIFASGTLGRKFKRRWTDQAEWDAARTIASQFERAGNWDGIMQPPLEAEQRIVDRARITIAEGLGAFAAHRKNHGVRLATLKKYGTFNRQVTAFTQNLGYVYLDQDFCIGSA